jgi:hypothetical protein
MQDRTFTIGISLDDPRVCRDELQISLARLEDGQRALQAAQANLYELASQTPTPSKVIASYLLGVQQAIDVQSVLRCIRNILRILESRNKAGEGNTQLLKAEADFKEAFPEAWNLRDILEHLPEYVAGKGNLQKNKEMPTDSNVPNLAYSSVTDALSEITLLFNFERQKLEVKAAARKAIEIAGLLGPDGISQEPS